jgi:hypothetical protein
MPKHRAIITASFVLALAALIPASAAANAGGTDRPVSGTSTSTTVLNTATGTGTSEGIGQLSHLGAFTFHNDFTSFTVTGPTTFSYTLTTIWVAANGDEIFTTGTATGTLTNGIESTLLSTITGGTGRFADASGTITSSVISVNVLPGVLHDTEIHEGQISY